MWCWVTAHIAVLLICALLYVKGNHLPPLPFFWLVYIYGGLGALAGILNMASMKTGRIYSALYPINYASIGGSRLYYVFLFMQNQIIFYFMTYVFMYSYLFGPEMK